MPLSRDVDPRLDNWLEQVWELQGSDLLFHSGQPVRQRVNGEFANVEDAPIAEELIGEIVRSLMSKAQLERLEATGECDFAFSWGDVARIRGNAYREQNHLALALRVLPNRVPTFDELALHPTIRNLANEKQGFVLICGRTGAGKSTTLASIGREIVETRPLHVLTIEDPIEYILQPGRAAVSQREVGTDTLSFASAIKACLRQTPDVIFLGEMRDTESIETALTIAETGHLVFSTAHTNDAAGALDRILDAVPSSDYNQVRASLAAALTAVVSQRLLPRKGGGRQVAVFEVLLATTAVRNLIRRGQMAGLVSQMDLGEQQGMVSLNYSLAAAVVADQIEEEVAFATTSDPTGLEMKIARLRTERP